MSNLSRRAVLTLGGAALLSGATVHTAHACFNDRDVDKLAEEAEKLPGIVEVITGRFERNPPLYYQMRIARSTAELVVNPRQYGLYDDVAVAYDRLGKSDDALAWMTKKRQMLQGTTPDMPDYHEAWYRYYANVGTARVHRWIRAGAKKERISEVEQARDEIIRALKIKPDAHFGREAYQLQVMEWIIAARKQDTAESLGASLEVREGLRKVDLASASYDDNKVVKGLAGLIVLGNAWESVDVFSALADKLGAEQKSMAQLASFRAAEITAHGGKSLVRDSGYWGVYTPYISEKLQAQLKKEYTALRAESEQWQKARTDYMMERLEAGRHPDTDPNFWADWHPAPAPKLSMDAPQLPANIEPPIERQDYLFAGKITLGVAALAIGGAILRYKNRSARLSP